MGSVPGAVPGASGAAPTGGVCYLLPGPGNPINGPCVNVLLALSDTAGTELFRTRTDPTGHFEFAAEAGKNYRVAPVSKAYELLSPTRVITGGEGFEVKLRQR